MYALGTGLSHCVVDGTVIVLDAPRDRYFGLTPTASRQFLALLNGTKRTADGNEAGRLIARGLLVEADEGQTSAIPTVAAATREWVPQGKFVRPRPRDQILALACILVTLLRLRISSFEQAIRPRKAGSRREPPAEPPPHLVAAFLSVISLLPGRLQCLPASLSLRAYLGLFSVPSDLVLAVTIRPFAAHCWVQIGDMLIGDTIERTSPFTPIRCVR